MKQHALRMPDELFDAINNAAGDVPRNTWIVRALESVIDGKRAARSPGNPAAAKAKREAPPDRRVKTSAEARRGAGPIPKAGKR